MACSGFCFLYFPREFLGESEGWYLDIRSKKFMNETNKLLLECFPKHVVHFIKTSSDMLSPNFNLSNGTVDPLIWAETVGEKGEGRFINALENSTDKS